jgi:hypothetical protein
MARFPGAAFRVHARRRGSRYNGAAGGGHQRQEVVVASQDEVERDRGGNEQEVKDNPEAPQAPQAPQAVRQRLSMRDEF